MRVEDEEAGEIAPVQFGRPDPLHDVHAPLRDVDRQVCELDERVQEVDRRVQEVNREVATASADRVRGREEGPAGEPVEEPAPVHALRLARGLPDVARRPEPAAPDLQLGP